MSIIIEESGNSAHIKSLDANVRNRFRWEWLDKLINLNDDTSYPLSECIYKLDTPGMALCMWCGHSINYGSAGFRALVDHASSKKHIERALELKEGCSGWTIPKLSLNMKSGYTILFQDQMNLSVIKEYDQNVKNKFSLKWLDRMAKAGDKDYKLKHCIHKVDLAGHALCIWCNDLINYGASGFKSLETHMRSRKHKDRAMLTTELNIHVPNEEEDRKSNNKTVYHVQLEKRARETGNMNADSSAETIKGQGYTLIRDDSINVRLLDGCVRNRFRWDWLDKTTTVSGSEYVFSDFFKKIDTPGQVMCLWCHVPVNYGTSGGKSLEDHTKTSRHLKKSRLKFLQAEKTNAGTEIVSLNKDKSLEELDSSSSLTTISDAVSNKTTSSDPPSESFDQFVEQITVKDYVKVIRCREYITTRRNIKTGVINIVSNKKEEGEPVISGLRSSVYTSQSTDSRLGNKRIYTSSDDSEMPCKIRKLKTEESIEEANNNNNETSEKSSSSSDSSVSVPPECVQLQDTGSSSSENEGDSNCSMGSNGAENALSKNKVPIRNSKSQSKAIETGKDTGLSTETSEIDIFIKTEPDVYVDYDFTECTNENMTVKLEPLSAKDEDDLKMIHVSGKIASYSMDQGRIKPTTFKCKKCHQKFDNIQAGLNHSQEHIIRQKEVNKTASSLSDDELTQCSNCKCLFRSKRKYGSHRKRGFCSLKQTAAMTAAGEEELHSDNDSTDCD